MRTISLNPTAEEFRRALLDWFSDHSRGGMPWRDDPTPYRVLVSEFMLQQTTVRAVLPYFDRFMSAFPDIRTLASAPQERVLELWSGLGYYSRARRLHEAARAVVEKFNGRVPDSRDILQSLPGIGPYTAGAIASIAFNKPEALVDGNVVRVLSRVYAIEDDMKRPSGVEKIWDVARALVPKKRPGDFNAALMDLGATVCRPADPLCLLCPLASVCNARAGGLQRELPVMEKDKPRKSVHLYVGIVSSDGRFFVRRREAGGLYGGLWEFPSQESRTELSISAVAKALEGAVRAPVALSAPDPEFRHVLTHKEFVVHVWRGTAAGRSGNENAAAEWKRPSDIEKMAISSLTRKALRATAATGAVL